MTNNVNFDELAQKAFAPIAGESDFENLFAAAFSLDAWYFIADAEFQYKMPYCAIFPSFFGEEIALTVFTDPARAMKFIAEKGINFGASGENPNVPNTPQDLVMLISTTGILDFFDRLSPLKVTKIFFNPNKDSEGFHHDLKMMRPIFKHLEGKNMISKPQTEISETVSEEDKQNSDQNAKKIKTSGGADFDALSEKAMETNAMEDLNRLFGATFALKQWNFISRGELPNVNPYVASNPTVANNQPMIRAFTDADRLMRFARENNLTETDGSAKILTIPTENIVPYLEGFISQGAFGVWFNSDSESKDFFIPLKQLQLIKDHLAKLNPPAKTEFTTLILTITDGLMFESGNVSKSSYNCNFFCWIPREWTEDLQLKNEYLEKLYEQFYGANWRSGNSDGSHYVVLEANSSVISPERMQGTDWSVVQNNELNKYWFYIGETGGTYRNVTVDEFKTNFDAHFQTKAQEKQDNAADFGVSETPDGDFDLNLNINKVGAVNFDTSIAPFYEAIAPLLQDFQGTGEYLTLLRFEDSGKSQQVENTAENAHGAYLQIRRFLYLNPKNNVRIGVNSIHSNHLRHVQTNAELIVSFELCKNLDNQTGVFYHAFQGAKADVLKLEAAIQPILEANNYKAVE